MKFSFVEAGIIALNLFLKLVSKAGAPSLEAKKPNTS